MKTEGQWIIVPVLGGSVIGPKLTTSEKIKKVLINTVARRVDEISGRLVRHGFARSRDELVNLPYAYALSKAHQLYGAFIMPGLWTQKGEPFDVRPIRGMNDKLVDTNWVYQALED